MFINENNLKKLPQADVIPPSLELDSAASVRGDNFVMEEIWKPILESAEYEVSSNCRIRTLKPCKRGQEPKILKQHISPTGYYCVGIYQGEGKQRCRKAHRLFAQIFIPNPLNLPQVNHIDGNKLNNHISNLEWVTNKQNSDHAWDHKLIPKSYGENTTKAVLRDNDIIFIFNSKEKSSVLAQKYNVHISTIQTVKNGKNWSWLTGKKYSKRILDKDRILAIYHSELTQQEIAYKFGVCRQYVNSIKLGTIYSEITGQQYKRKMIIK